MVGWYPEAWATGDPPASLVAGAEPAGDLAGGELVPDDVEDVQDAPTTQASMRTAISLPDMMPPPSALFGPFHRPPWPCHPESTLRYSALLSAVSSTALEDRAGRFACESWWWKTPRGWQACFGAACARRGTRSTSWATAKTPCGWPRRTRTTRSFSTSCCPTSTVSRSAAVSGRPASGPRC